MTTPSPSDPLEEGCRKTRAFLEENPGAWGVYHWDADGMASAALVKRLLAPDLRLEPPPIAGFSPRFVLEPAEKGSATISIDYGVRLPRDTGNRALSRVAVIDHHRTTYPPQLNAQCNPVASGKGGEKEYPSATWVVWRHLLGERGGDVEKQLVALGVLGDLGRRWPSYPAGEWAVGVMRGAGLGVEGALRLVALVDSCYKVVDRECVRYTTLRLAREGPLALAGDRRLENNVARVEEEVRAVGGMEPDKVIVMDGFSVAVWWHRSGLYTTSTLGRMLAESSGYDVVVLVHEVTSLGRVFVYVRSRSLPVGAWVLDELRRRGYNAGGKDSVAVVECRDRGCAEESLGQVMRILESRSRDLPGRG